MYFQLPLRYLHLSCVTSNAYFKKINVKNKIKQDTSLVTNCLCNATARVSFVQGGNKKLSLSSLFLHMQLLYPLYFSFPKIFVVFICLTYATTSQTYSLLTLLAASSYFYSIRSNFCSYIDLPKAHFLSHYASGQKFSVAFQSKTKSKFPILSLNTSLLQKPVLCMSSLLTSLWAITVSSKYSIFPNLMPFLTIFRTYCRQSTIFIEWKQGLQYNAK